MGRNFFLLVFHCQARLLLTHFLRGLLAFRPDLMQKPGLCFGDGLYMLHGAWAKSGMGRRFASHLPAVTAGLLASVLEGMVLRNLGQALGTGPYVFHAGV